jgi:hypothetical protein
MVKRLIIGFIIVAAICIGWFFFRDDIRERLSRRKFDPASWQSSQSSTNAIRIRMVDDLLRSYQFRGMTRQQVVAIIGEPDKTEYFKDWDMVYWLGPERGWMSIDSEWLVFRLNEQKQVANYKIVRD